MPFRARHPARSTDAWVHPTPTLYSLACDGPEFIYRVAKTSADTLSHRGPARARFYAMDAPRYVLSSLTSIASARPCCLLLALALLLGRLRLPACAVPPATADAHVHFHLRHAASRPRRPAGAARRALPLPPAAHVRQGSMRGMRGMRGRHGGGRRGGREAARRRGLARVHTGGQERPKSDDEHTVGSLRRESAPGTRACVRSLSSTSPCDGDTTVSARVQTAVSTPCGGSTQGQRVRGHNRRAARRAQSALGLSYTPAFPAHAQAPPPPLPCRGSGRCPAGSSARASACAMAAQRQRPP